MSENLAVMPMLVLRGIVMFPDMTLHFDVSREKSIYAINKAMEADRKVFLSLQEDISLMDPVAQQVYKTGCVATIKQVLKVPGENMIKVMVEGVCRATVLDYIFEDPYFCVSVKMLSDSIPSASNSRYTALTRLIKDSFDHYVQLSGRVSPDVISHVIMEEDCGLLADYIAFNLPMPWEDKQHILEQLDPIKRAEELISLLTNECEIVSIDNEIHQKVQNAMDDNQKDYFLREQLKVIQDELGISDEEEEFSRYRKQIEQLDCSQDIKDKLLHEVDKLAKLPMGSHEGSVIRGYLDCCLELPWGIVTEDKINLKQARAILNRDHYGLEKIKERILELLAVKKLAPDNNGCILCLVGPPGVGKTSIASSVASCMGRSFARVSLGGVKDESEIRGHRRTYIGSMPGRILSALSDAKTSNPVMLLDEIDKIGNDFKGDCSASLLEVLDLEQNVAFKDHFVDLPFDLSKVLFITTANDAGAIPAPLYDRMEVIEITSYSPEEKFNIAKKHLIPKQRAKHGLTAKQCKISDDAIRILIDNYTREGGVRTLERSIATLCRKSAVQIVNGKESTSITKKNLTEWLGAKKFKTESVADRTDEIGLVNGLAWTSVGGEVMPIEASVLPGTGKIELTGNLGDVMQESAKTAINYVRSIALQYAVDCDFYKTKDFHVHASQAAVPKDGPSAGVAMAVVMLSALTGTPIRHDVAMTGEISLRGKVLPIGGLKEKAMAAYKAGVKTVILPEQNRVDLEQVEDVVKDNVQFVFVDHINSVLPIVMNLPKSKKSHAYVPNKADSVMQQVRI